MDAVSAFTNGENTWDIQWLNSFYGFCGKRIGNVFFGQQRIQLAGKGFADRPFRLIRAGNGGQTRRAQQVEISVIVPGGHPAAEARHLAALFNRHKPRGAGLRRRIPGVLRQQQVRNIKKQPLRTALPAGIGHSLTFNFSIGMNLDEQLSPRNQPLRAAMNQRAGLIRAEHVQFTEGHHNEIKLGFRRVVANVLLVIGNIQPGRLRLLPGPGDRRRRKIHARTVKAALRQQAGVKARPAAEVQNARAGG